MADSRGLRWLRRLTPVLALLLIGVVQAPAPADQWTPGPTIYGVGKDPNVPVTMSDGTVLRADVYYPTDFTGTPATGPFPVILTQTPYGKTAGSYSTPSFGGGPVPSLISRGYIHVVVDIRGTGGSRGKFGLFDPIQADDGVELVHWAAARPNSNGKVGTLGPSYLGYIQVLTAAKIGPNSPLKAIFPIVIGNDIYRDAVVAGGVPNFEFNAPYAAFMVGANQVNPLFEHYYDPEEFLSVSQDHSDGPLHWQIPTFKEFFTDGDLAYAGDYWHERSPEAHLQTLVENDIPAFFVGGWHDLFQRGTPLNYSGIQNAFFGRNVRAPMGPSQSVTGRYQLMMGPWYHVTYGLATNLEEIQLRWFDTWLKGQATGMAESQKPMHLYQAGSNRWVDTSHYPFGEASAQTYYLQAGGSLTASAPTVAQGEDMIVYAGASSPCSRSTEQWGAGLGMLATFGFEPCATNNSTTQVGPGALTYTTAPLSQATVMAGPISATIYATSTRPDTLLIATLDSVAPNGTATPITSGTLLGSFRALDNSKTWVGSNGEPILPYHPYTRESLDEVVPGAVTRFDIEIFPAFVQIAAGHRIRLAITTSDTPHILPTPSQGERLTGGIYQVQRNAGAASFVNIPIAPASAFGTLCSIC